MNGHSGSLIDISEQQVIKFADPKDPNRLQRQVNKQLKFLGLDHGFKVPAIFATFKTKICMERLHGWSAAWFLKNESIPEVRIFTETLIKFIRFCVECSPVLTISRTVMLDKYDQVKRDSSFDFEFYNLPATLELPIGLCHGDFTLSNMMYTSRGRFATYDFLDCYIETPLADIAKLRQDTRHYWSFFIDNLELNNRARMMLNYIDREIQKEFEKEDWMRYARHMEILALLRIFPYATESKTEDYLSARLECLKI